MVRQGLLKRYRRNTGEIVNVLLSFDEPCPSIMAEGIAGIGRRGWQYAVVGGTTLLPPDFIPREGSEVDSAGELAAIRAYECQASD